MASVDRRGIPGQAAFTLFEVMVSLLVMSVAVTSVLALFPSGIKSQQLARFQVLAAAKVMDIAVINANQWRKWDKQRLENDRNAISVNDCAQRSDIDQKCSNWRHGNLPLPTVIARRLDSDNDEIKAILDQGGSLFYASPFRVTSTEAGETTDTSERALPNEAVKLVFAFVGCPQQAALVNHPNKAWPYQDFYPTPPRGEPHHRSDWLVNGWPGLAEFDACRTAWAACDADVKDGTPGTAAGLVETFIDKAKALAVAVGLPIDADGVAGDPPGDAFTAVEPWRVEAANYLALALMWRGSSNLVSTPPTPAQEDIGRRAHEQFLVWFHRYSSTSPYDWGMMRSPLFDNGWNSPLLQAQLFPKPACEVAGPAGEWYWKTIPAQPVTNPGRAESRDNGPVIAASWGDPSRFTLCRRFAAAERCRQVVFWAVDWQSYEDFEEAPCAAPDASRIPYDTNGTYIGNQTAHKFDIPERDLVWEDASRSRRDWSFTNKQQALGVFGADRNFNNVFDRGPVPPSVRLRATFVARFNLYNQRIWAQLRN
ncbi:MAG: type II secretion system protein [Minicystis sp.]